MSMRYDIFISYAHADGKWVEPELYQRLLRCRRRRDGQRPDVFFDRDRTSGLLPGLSWRNKLAEAARLCHRFVPVYSEMYFQSDECDAELGFAVNRDPAGKHGVIVPILVDSCPLPDSLWNRQFLSVRDVPDWFDRLCDQLELDPVEERLALQFVQQPADVQVNETLHPVKIRICDASGATYASAEIVTLAAEEAVLEGELSQPANQGMVEFTELSIAQPIASTRLVARCEGFEFLYSQPFQVKPAPPVKTGRSAGEIPDAANPSDNLVIAAAGQPVFFADGRGLAVIGENQLTAYALPARTPLFPEPLRLYGRPRLTARALQSLVLGDWEGYVYVLSLDRPPQVWKFRDEGRSLNIIGAIACDGDDIAVGLWSGEVFRLTPRDPPRFVLQHPGGVQALALCGSAIALADLNGKLHFYRDAVCTRTLPVEPMVRLLKSYGRDLVIVGRNRMYQVAWDGDSLLSEESVLTDMAAVYGDCPLPVVIDRQGRGVRIDSELACRGSFRTVPGAQPVSADDRGHWCVFHNRDGSHTLLTRQTPGWQGRIVRTCPGPLAVSPRGDLLAVSVSDSIRLYDPTAFSRAAGEE